VVHRSGAPPRSGSLLFRQHLDNHSTVDCCGWIGNRAFVRKKNPNDVSDDFKEMVSTSLSTWTNVY
jgi:hypothetical protein